MEDGRDQGTIPTMMTAALNDLYDTHVAIAVLNGRPRKWSKRLAGR
jgi:hypothetical protein